jgi:NAD dependent epimerase/dehydratase family enzyme
VLALAESPWSNRIYSKDLVRICQAASQAAYPGVINVVDDEPSSISAYFMAVADCLGLPTPVEIGLDEAKARMSAGLLSYLRESRRIRNDKLKQVLGIQLSYPTLALGLADIVQSPSAEKI